MSVPWRRAAVSAALFACALLFAAIAACFACGAVYLALLPIASPALAALGAAGAALVAAGALLIAGRALVARLARTAQSALDPHAIVAALGGALGGEAADFATAHPRGTLVGSLVAGFAMGADPALRRAFRSLLS